MLKKMNFRIIKTILFFFILESYSQDLDLITFIFQSPPPPPCPTFTSSRDCIFGGVYTDEYIKKDYSSNGCNVDCYCHAFGKPNFECFGNVVLPGVCKSTVFITNQNVHFNVSLSELHSCEYEWHLDKYRKVCKDFCNNYMKTVNTSNIDFGKANVTCSLKPISNDCTPVPAFSPTIHTNIPSISSINNWIPWNKTMLNKTCSNTNIIDVKNNMICVNKNGTWVWRYLCVRTNKNGINILIECPSIDIPIGIYCNNVCPVDWECNYNIDPNGVCIPVCYGLPSNMTGMYIHENSISGSIPLPKIPCPY